MARPTKHPEALDKVLPPIRVTAEQAAQIKAKADEADLSVSDYARAVLCGAKPRNRKAKPHELEAVKALGQLGNIRADINQILRDRFSNRFVNPDRVDKALSAIVELGQHLHEILKRHGN